MEAFRRVHFAGAAGPFLGFQLWRGFLTLITIGIHRFWWRTAMRRRLWRETTVDGDPLEYRGTAMELVLGLMLASVIVGIPLTLLGQGGQLLLAAGQVGTGLLLQLSVFALFPWIFGFAIYRARKYLLSRSAWRGIRGGMTENGIAYAWLSFRLTLVQLVTLGLATPWVSARRWNALWRDARFGTEAFAAELAWRPLVKPWLVSIVLAGLLVLLPILIGAGTVIAMGDFDPAVDIETIPEAERNRAVLFLFAGIFGGMALAWLLVPVAMVPWRAAFLRDAVGATTLGPVRFAFAAGWRDWLWYLGGNALIVIATLGFGLLLLPWRQWEFWTRHLRIAGELDPEWVRQSQLAAPGHGEGLADAFDVGGI
jgi:uncharacterized membrane protein YjgN (DUF898 family)